MAVCTTMTHVVQPGDTFYRLAQQYKTTVPEIILRNPGVNPYNLQVGTRLIICNNQGTVQREEIDLNNDMRKGWMQHNYRMRMFMTSLFQELGDLEAVENALMRIPEEIAAVFGNFYPQSAVNQLTQLLKEHTGLAGEVMRLTKGPDMTGIEEAERRWYQNAEQLAGALANLNPRYSYQEILSHLTKHLDLMKGQMLAALNQEFDRALSLFSESEEHLLELADYLTKGLVNQFYKEP